MFSHVHMNAHRSPWPSRGVTRTATSPCATHFRGGWKRNYMAIGRHLMALAQKVVQSQRVQKCSQGIARWRRLLLLCLFFSLFYSWWRRSGSPGLLGARSSSNPVLLLQVYHRHRAGGVPQEGGGMQDLLQVVQLLLIQQRPGIPKKFRDPLGRRFGGVPLLGGCHQELPIPMPHPLQHIDNSQVRWVPETLTPHKHHKNYQELEGESPLPHDRERGVSIHNDMDAIPISVCLMRAANSAKDNGPCNTKDGKKQF